MARVDREGRDVPPGHPKALQGNALSLSTPTDAELVERLLAAAPPERAALESKLIDRAGDPRRRDTLRRALGARAQDADEYLGATAEVARHYLAVLDTVAGCPGGPAAIPRGEPRLPKT